MEKKPIIIITGPTAVGKTSLSIPLARQIGGEIISADSMQVYKEMNIGTAKIKTEEMEGVPHHLIDILYPDEEFHVVRFQQMAKEAMEKIYKNGHIPIVVGGTGFYIQALLYDIDFSQEEQETEFRLQMEQFAKEYGNEALHKKLELVDPVSAQKIHANNVKRVIRALEYYEQQKSPISEHNETQSQKESPYNFLYFVLEHEREVLYDRINRRVDQMMEDGLLSEMETLIKKGYTKELVSMQGIGYKEFFPYFEGQCTLDDVIYKIKLDTRHFAKRQLTWFKREKEVIWLSKKDYSEEQLYKQIVFQIQKNNMLSF